MVKLNNSGKKDRSSPYDRYCFTRGTNHRDTETQRRPTQRRPMKNEEGRIAKEGASRQGTLPPLPGILNSSFFFFQFSLVFSVLVFSVSLCLCG
jgi:hypothetical protein